MRLPMRHILAPAALLCAATVASAQAPAPAAAASAAPAGAGAARPFYNLLEPTVARVGQAVADVRIEKWKSQDNLRQEADGNLTSIRRDVQETLPSLVIAADAQPNSVAAALPVLRNVGALYDVLLRVVEESRVAAPHGQTDELEQALLTLEDTRRTLADQVEANAAAQEKRLTAAVAALHTPPPPPPAQDCPKPVAPKPARKKHAKSATTKKTTTPPANTGAQ